ncbi:MAG: hypothetical protein KA144_15060 [Xanthomonadaceae bacterium]|nr:hypothetical protein [Xanthomonadaceae bacterium]
MRRPHNHLIYMDEFGMRGIREATAPIDVGTNDGEPAAEQRVAEKPRIEILTEPRFDNALVPAKACTQASGQFDPSRGRLMILQ